MAEIRADEPDLVGVLMRAGRGATRHAEVRAAQVAELAVIVADPTGTAGVPGAGPR